jgi:hypothetical protein
MIKFYTMKNTLSLAIALLLSIATLSAQENEAATSYDTEFGTDIITLVNQVLNFGGDPFARIYDPVYQVTFKQRIGERVKLRAAVGGYMDNTEREIFPEEEPSEVRTRDQSLFNYRLGVEWDKPLSNRWSFYYGLDFRHRISTRFNESQYQNGGYRVGVKSEYHRLGVAPLMGIEFNISDRVTLQTEASWLLYLERGESKPIITQIVEEPSHDPPSASREENRGNGSFFSVPNFLVLTVKI